MHPAESLRSGRKCGIGIFCTHFKSDDSRAVWAEPDLNRAPGRHSICIRCDLGAM